MKPKERKEALSELRLLSEFLKGYSLTVKVMFPGIVPQIKEIYNEILYSDIDEKKRGLLLNAEKKRNVVKLVETVTKFKSDFIGALNSSEKDKIVLTKNIKGLADKFTVGDDYFFQELQLAVQGAVNNAKGIFVNKKDLQKEIVDAIEQTYSDLDVSKIEKCKSIRAIRNLGIDIIDEFLDNYRLKYKSGITAPNYTNFVSELNKIFNDYAVLSQADFDEQVQQWFGEVADNLSTLSGNKYAKAPVVIAEATAKLKQQTVRFVEKGLEAVGQEVVNCLASIEDGLSLEEVIQALSKKLPSITIPQLAPVQISEISTEQGYVTRKLSDTIIFKDVLPESIDPLSPIFIVAQPGFRQNLISSLNDWKDELTNSLMNAADLILSLDGCTIDGTLLLKTILGSCKIDAVSQAISSLSFGEMKLLRHKDLSEFKTQWGQPWETAIQSIDVETDVINVLEAEQLVELYEDVHAFLPSADGVIATLNICVGGKVNLALRAVQRLKKEVNQISEKVTILEKVNDLQTLGLGFNSMITEVDLVFKKIVEAHKIRNNKINVFCLEYDSAQRQAAKSFKEFNKAAADIEAFRAAVFDAFLGIATAALCVSGVGPLVVGALAVTETVAKATITATVKVAVAATGIKKAVTGGLARIENSSPSTLVKYLDKQIAAEKEIIAVLNDLIQISENIQYVNSYIQYLLENNGEGDVDINSLINEYEKYSASLTTWISEQKKNINIYNGESAKMTIQKNTTKVLMERNMYVKSIADAFKNEIKDDHWQTLCDSKKEFRPRLLVTGLIREKDFVDNLGVDGGWADELKRLYKQKEIPLF